MAVDKLRAWRKVTSLSLEYYEFVPADNCQTRNQYEALVKIPAKLVKPFTNDIAIVSQTTHFELTILTASGVDELPYSCNFRADNYSLTNFSC